MTNFVTMFIHQAHFGDVWVIRVLEHKILKQAGQLASNLLSCLEPRENGIPNNIQNLGRSLVQRVYDSIYLK